MRLTDLRDRSVAVWGTDDEGRAAVAAIAACGPSRLLAVDDSAAYPAIAWDDERAPLAGGDHAFPALAAADVIVRSAVVPETHPWLIQLRERKMAITTGSALWLADHAPQAIIVTGGAGKDVTAGLLGHLLTALGRPTVVAGETPLLALPEAGQYVAGFSAAQCADLGIAPKVVVLLPGAHERLRLLDHGPDLIVVDGTDVPLRDALRGRFDANGFPPIPAGAGDSRFRVEDGAVYCSDEQLFPRSALSLGTEPPSSAEGGEESAQDGADRHGLSLCVALAVLDGLGFDVPGSAAALRAAAGSFTR